MNTSLVSIIIPVYNAARYLAETLQSILNQTHPNWELLVVDDGSSDASVSIVEEFIAQHSRGTLLVHPGRANRGSSASRNLGLSRAKGEYVCFLDADDVWNPEFLSFYLEKFASLGEIGMAYCPCLLWYGFTGNGADQARDALQKLAVKGDSVVPGRDLLELFLCNEDAVPSPSGTMIRRELLGAVNGWEDQFRGMYDDQVLYAKLFVKGIQAYVADRSLYRYRQHGESLCSMVVRENRLLESRKRYLAWITDYLEQHEQLTEALRGIISEQSLRLQLDQALESSQGQQVRSPGTIFSRLVKLKNDLCLVFRVARYGVGKAAARVYLAGSAKGLVILSEDCMVLDYLYLF